jgi:hypothetical protein
MTRKFLSLILGVFVLLSFNLPVLAWDDWTYGPIVNNISGPTSGIVGQTYSFSAEITSTSETPIRAGLIEETTDLNSADNSNILLWEDAAEESSTCTSLSCNISGEFTPESSGTYYVFIGVNFLSAPENETGTHCNTHPSVDEAGCFNSRGKYITFVVGEDDGSGEDALPETATVPTRTYVLVSSGLLLILSSSIIKNIKFPNLEDKKREKLEKKFE